MNKKISQQNQKKKYTKTLKHSAKQKRKTKHSTPVSFG